MLLLLKYLPLTIALSLLSFDAVAESTALLNGTIIDGSDRPPLKDGVIIIKDGKISAVGHKNDIAILPNARIIDARGTFITPGLIDAHIHFFQSGGIYTRPDAIDLRRYRSYDDEIAEIRRRLPETLSRYLCSGITSVVDAGGPLWTLAMKQTYATLEQAPRLAFAGPLLSSLIPKALATKDRANVKLKNGESIAKNIQEFSERGADFIKIWLPKTKDLLSQWAHVEASIKAAHSRGLRVMVHATELALARRAVLLGADILAHSVNDTVIDDEFLALLKKNNVIYIPTLVVKKNYRDILEGYAQETSFDRLCGDNEAIASWYQMPKQTSRSPFSWLKVSAENLVRVHRAGIRIAAGSDAGNIGTLHGPGLLKELLMLVKAGLSPHQALSAATRDAAFVFKNNPDIGLIKDGYRADLLILSANPLIDIGNLQKIVGVIKGGVVVKGALKNSAIHTFAVDR